MTVKVLKYLPLNKIQFKTPGLFEKMFKSKSALKNTLKHWKPATRKWNIKKWIPSPKALAVVSLAGVGFGTLATYVSDYQKDHTGCFSDRDGCKIVELSCCNNGVTSRTKICTHLNFKSISNCQSWDKTTWENQEDQEPQECCKECNETNVGMKVTCRVATVMEALSDFYDKNVVQYARYFKYIIIFMVSFLLGFIGLQITTALYSS